MIVGLVLLIISLAIIASYTKPEDTTVSVLAGVSSFSGLTPIQFNQELNTGKYILIDVRPLDQYSEGHLKNAILSDYLQAEDFSKFLDSLDKRAKYLIYCRSGVKSAKTLKIMREKGFTTVYDLTGGYLAWVDSGLPVEK